LQTHFGQANEDVRLIAVSAEKIDRRAERIRDLEFEGDDKAIEAPRGKPELFAVPTPRKLQAGE
jgi:DNA recombination protein RmuC